MQTYPHDSAFDGVEVYLPDISKFLPGDLLLTHNANDESGKLRGQSKAVVLATRGTFDHVMICAESPTFVEAIPPLVANFSVARTFAYDLKNIRVLRYPDVVIASKAAQAAQQHLGRNYSILRAAMTVLPEGLAKRVTNKGIFCSALAAHLFVEAGATEFSATPIGKTTPATIENMQCLQDVTDQVFQKQLAPKNIENFSALDGTRRPSPATEQSAIMARYYKATFPFVESVIGDPAFPPEQMPLSFADILMIIYGSHQIMSKMSHTDRTRFMVALSSLDEEVAKLIGSGELQKVFHTASSYEQASLQRMMLESFQQSPDIDLEHLKQQLLVTNKQLAVRTAGLEPFKSLEGRSKAALGWISFSELVVTGLTQRRQVYSEVISRLDGS